MQMVDGINDEREEMDVEDADEEERRRRRRKEKRKRRLSREQNANQSLEASEDDRVRSQLERRQEDEEDNAESRANQAEIEFIRESIGNWSLDKIKKFYMDNTDKQFLFMSALNLAIDDVSNKLSTQANDRLHSLLNRHAELSSFAGDIFSKQAQDKDMIFDENKFISLLTKSYGSNNENSLDNEEEDLSESTKYLDYKKLIPLAAQYFNAVEFSGFLFGPHSRDLPEKRKINNRNKNDLSTGLAKETNFNDLNQINTSGGLKADEIATKIQHIIMTNGKCELFRLCINPESFAQSVENMLCISFLVKDGFVRIYVDKGEMWVTPSQPDSNVPKSNFKQSILTLNYDIYQKFINIYNIEKPMIPTRIQ